MDLAFAEAIFDIYASYMVNIDRDQIIARHIETPLDRNNHSMNLMNGDIFGIGSTAGQLLGRRPTPELSRCKVPGVGGPYLSGCVQHPGGTVNFGGRATAMRMAIDMGIDLKSIFEAY